MDGSRARTPPAGVRRFSAAEIEGKRLDVRIGSGRIELGASAGEHLRVRWTLPAPRLPRLRSAKPRAPRLRLEGGGLRIRTRRARLQLDLPAGLTVVARLRRGEITSWGAGGDLTLISPEGSISCRELTARSVLARGTRVNLHFAAAPDRLEVDASQVLLALPGGPYRVTAPADAEVTVPTDSDAVSHVLVRGPRARVLAAGVPLPLDGDRPSGS